MDTNFFWSRSPDCYPCNFYIVRIGIFTQNLGAHPKTRPPGYRAPVKVHPCFQLFTYFVDYFSLILKESMNKNISTRVCKKKKSVPWFNRDLRRMVRQKSRLFKHAKKTKQWGAFKNFQTECKKAFKKAEIDHINGTIQKGLDERNTKLPTTSMEPSKRVLMKETPNCSGGTSSPDVKTLFVTLIHLKGWNNL